MGKKDSLDLEQLMSELPKKRDKKHFQRLQSEPTEDANQLNPAHLKLKSTNTLRAGRRRSVQTSNSHASRSSAQSHHDEGPGINLLDIGSD